MIEELYSEIYSKEEKLQLGSIVWCPAINFEEVPKILDVARADEKSHYATSFEISQIDNSRHFKKTDKLPIKLLSLGSTEELLISRAKKRPCVVVSHPKTKFFDDAITTEIARRKHLQDGSVLLAPCFSVATPEDASGPGPIMTARIRACMYNQFFYLPEKCPKTGNVLAKASVARFDRVFPAAYNRGMELMKVRLADEPLKLMVNILREYLGGYTDDNLTLVREILSETLPETAKPVAA